MDITADRDGQEKKKQKEKKMGRETPWGKAVLTIDARVGEGGQRKEDVCERKYLPAWYQQEKKTQGQQLRQVVIYCCIWVVVVVVVVLSLLLLLSLV